jgi:O-antigen/teichoic acid export membrane protein
LFTPVSGVVHDQLKTDHLKAELKSRSVRGGIMTMIGQAVGFLLQIISTVVLARLLTPADYGLVAMVAAISGFMQIGIDAGLSQATIQRPEINHRQVSTLFWVNVGFSFLLMIVFSALAPVLAWFYGEPRVVLITLVVAGTFLLVGFTVQHDALLRRQMRFVSLAVRDIAASFIGVAVAILMAWRGAGYWALIVLPAATGLVKMVLTWLLSGWRPGPPSWSPEVRSMVGFGGHLVGTNVIAHVDRNADNVLIGWFWGAGPLGLYSRAYSILMLPLRQINTPVFAVALPAFSRIHDDHERFARYYLRTMNLIMWISAPLIGFLFIAAEPVINVVLGPQWREAAVVFQFLSIGALTQPLYNSTGLVFVSRGHANRLFKLAVYIFPVIVGSFLVGLPFGIKGVALCYSVVLLIIFPFVFRFTFQGTQLTLWGFGRALMWPVSLCLVAVFAAALAVYFAVPQGNLLWLLLVATVFAIVYAMSLLIRPVREEMKSLVELWRDRNKSK